MAGIFPPCECTEGMQKLKSNGIPDRHLKAWPLRWRPFLYARRFDGYEEAASQQVKSKPSRNEPGGPFHWECGRIASHFKRGSILSKAQNTGTSGYAAKTKTRNGSESPWRPTLFITNSGICYYYQQSRITRVMCITKTGQKPTIAERTSFRLFQ